MKGAGIMRCDVCNTEIPDGAEECPKCGLKVCYMQGASETETNSGNKRVNSDSRKEKHAQNPKAKRKQLLNTKKLSIKNILILCAGLLIIVVLLSFLGLVLKMGNGCIISTR